MIDRSKVPPVTQEPDPCPVQPIAGLPAGACDTHAHVFDQTGVFPCISDRSYTPSLKSGEAEYRRLLRTLGFSRAVLVQPSVYGTDNSFMLSVLSSIRANDEFQWRGVVVLDESVSDRELERLHSLGVRGIRLNMLFLGGVGFSKTERLVHRISELGWHVQILTDLSRLEHVHECLCRVPAEIVIDHMGHVPTAAGIKTAGFQDLLALLREGRAWVKLTGPDRITAGKNLLYTDVEPFVGALLEANIDQCLFGTDWPHVHLPGAMPNDGRLVNHFLRLVHSSNHQKTILVDNPVRLYGF